MNTAPLCYSLDKHSKRRGTATDVWWGPLSIRAFQVVGEGSRRYKNNYLFEIFTGFEIEVTNNYNKYIFLSFIQILNCIIFTLSVWHGALLESRVSCLFRRSLFINCFNLVFNIHLFDI